MDKPTACRGYKSGVFRFKICYAYRPVPITTAPDYITVVKELKSNQKPLIATTDNRS